MSSDSAPQACVLQPGEPWCACVCARVCVWAAVGPVEGSLHIPLTTTEAQRDPITGDPLPSNTAVVYFTPPLAPGEHEVRMVLVEPGV